MKFVIDIPEREFKGEIADHFQDFFMRLQAEIQYRLSSNDTLLCGNYELETVEMFLKSFKNAIIEQEPCEVCEECNLYGTTGTDHCEHDCVDGALDIIGKYQKIEQIFKEPCIIPEGCYPMLRKIKRVVEDGNDKRIL